jgi:hypothetical protein
MNRGHADCLIASLHKKPISSIDQCCLSGLQIGNRPPNRTF